MRIKHNKNIYKTLLISFLAIMLNACAGDFVVNYEAPPVSKIETLNDKVKLDVLLVVPDYFQNYIHYYQLSERNPINKIFMGNSLRMYAEKVSKDVFRTMSICYGVYSILGNVDWSNTSHLIILIPTTVNITNHMGPLAFNKAKTEVAVNWQIYSLKNEMLWTKGYIGRGKGYSGLTTSVYKNLGERIELAITDLTEITINSMITSPELRQLEDKIPLYNSDSSSFSGLSKPILHQTIDVNEKIQKALTILYFAQTHGKFSIVEKFCSAEVDANGRVGELVTTSLPHKAP